MKILGIDSSTKNLCLGLYVDGKFYEYSLKAGRKISSILAPAIQKVTHALGLKIADIDYFACGLGPGSFTGMRIGLATIKGLSLVSGRPVIGVSSLDILAKNVQLKDRLIVPALDAKRGLIYCSSYKYEKGILKRQSEYALLNLNEFVKKFRAAPIVLGDAAILYRDKILSCIKGATVLDKDYGDLQAHNFIKLVCLKIKAGQVSSGLTVKPIYLYPKECQIKTK
jgi:tRNA threonylcarbamoyl adenosine modification protein YeaZ